VASPIINDVIQSKLHAFAKEVVRRAKLELGTKKRIKYNDGKTANRRMVSSGNLQSSIGYVITAGGVHSALEFFMASYGKYLDAGVSGRKFKVQGGSPYSYQNAYSMKSNAHQMSILKWMNKRRIKVRDPETGSFVKQTDANRKNLAWVIARKVKDRGLPKTEFFTKGLEELYADLPAQLQFIVAEEIEKMIDEFNIDI
jgi:hypothetical protein